MEFHEKTGRYDGHASILLFGFGLFLGWWLKLTRARGGGGLFLKEALDDFHKLVGVHLGGSLEHWVSLRSGWQRTSVALCFVS